MASREIIEQVDTDAGEIVLRGAGAASGATTYELVVNGVFLMSTDDGLSERRLAAESLSRLPASSRCAVLIGGLGLGLTLRAALDDPRVYHVHVVELVPEVVRWNQTILAPANNSAVADPRVTVEVGDVHDALGGPPRAFDAVLLDVDNGPTAIARPDNAALYDQRSMLAMRRLLCRPGVLGVWSDKPAPEFRAELAEIYDAVDEISVDSGSAAIRRVGPDIIYCARVN
jgi:spermidine synthase